MDGFNEDRINDKPIYKKDLYDLLKGTMLISIPLGVVMGTAAAYAINPSIRAGIDNFITNIAGYLF